MNRLFGKGLLLFMLATTMTVNVQGQNSNQMETNPSTAEKAITMNLYYTGENGNARKFAEEMERSGTADSIRREPGNLRYEYFFPMNDPETVMLIDSWSSQAAIDAHHATPMMQTIARLREKYDLHMRAERYLKDEQGVPGKDDQFIRH